MEDTKRCVFVKGSTGGQQLHNVMKDLAALKKPYTANLSRKNEGIHPFEDCSSLEFLADKANCQFVLFGSNSKKRPNCLTWIRLFDGKVYDMFEMLISMDSVKLMSSFEGIKSNLGVRPAILFSGALFDSDEKYQMVRNFLLDFFAVEPTTHDKIDTASLQLLISVIATDDGLLFRTYNIQKGKNMAFTFIDSGPNFNFQVGRYQLPSADACKAALKVFKKEKKESTMVQKNVAINIMGDKVGRIHVGQQNLAKLQTRKMKGLKRSAPNALDDENGPSKKKIED